MATPRHAVVSFLLASLPCSSPPFSGRSASKSSVVRLVSSHLLFLLSLDISPLPLTTSLLWPPNPKTLLTLCLNNNRHLKNLLQSVPFFPDLPPNIVPKIRKLSQPLHKSIRPPNPHHLNPTITLTRPPLPPSLSLRPRPRPPLQAPTRMVQLSLTLRLQILVRIPNKRLSRLLRKPHLTRLQLSQ